MQHFNDLTVFIFRRNDLDAAQTDVQPLHSSFHLGMIACHLFGFQPGIPFLITKEDLRTASLRKLIQKCIDGNIPHYAMFDEDVDKENPTSLAVFPVEPEHVLICRKYPLRKYTPVAQAHLGNQGGRANADVAQESPKGQLEHSVSNGEVAGADPAVSSTIQGLA